MSDRRDYSIVFGKPPPVPDVSTAADPYYLRSNPYHLGQDMVICLYGGSLTSRRGDVKGRGTLSAAALLPSAFCSQNPTNSGSG